MYNHNKAQQSKKRVYISWDILYACMGNYIQMKYVMQLLNFNGKTTFGPFY